MVSLRVKCYHCGSDNVILSGFTRNGKRRYLCKTCGKTSRENPELNGYSEEEKEAILRAYEERSSLRGLTRTFGVARNTVTGWLKKKAERLGELKESLLFPTMEQAESMVIELDELWSYVYEKSQKKWIWLAQCRATRQILAYAIGDRSQATGTILWERIPPIYRMGQCYTDFWEAYGKMIPSRQHHAVGKETGQTAHIERFNNTLRQRLARLVRKTLSFSKSDVMHEICIKLFLHQYNQSIKK